VERKIFYVGDPVKVVMEVLKQTMHSFQTEFILAAAAVLLLHFLVYPHLPETVEEL